MIVIKTGNFQMNAGIVGLYNILTESGLVEGRDFSKTENRLEIDESIFRDHNFGQIYMETLLRHYKSTALNQWMKQIEMLKLTDGNSEDVLPEIRIFKREKCWIIAAGTLPEDKSRALLDLANRAVSLKMIESKKRDKAQDVIRSAGIELLPIKAATYEEKKQLAFDVYDWLQDDENFNACQMSIIFQDYVSKFWAEKHFFNKNKQSDIISLKETEILKHGGFADAYNNAFIEPVLTEQKKRTLRCIECGALTQKSIMKNITFTENIWSDFGRKTSVLWDFKGDTFLCPLCALIYSCAPLGFSLFGKDLLFINNNSKVETLISANKEKQADRETGEKVSHWFNRVRHVIDANASESVVQNLQVIIIKSDSSTCNFRFISKLAADIIRSSSKSLETLAKQNVWYQQGSSHINLYEQVAYRIMNLCDIDDLIDMCLREGKYAASTLINIQISIIERRGNLKKDELREHKRKAFGCGRYFRDAYLAHKGTEDDKALNGIIHPLLNSIECSNTAAIYSILLRVYNAMGIPAPGRLIEKMTEGNEDAKQIGFAFVAGIQTKPINNDKQEGAN